MPVQKSLKYLRRLLEELLTLQQKLLSTSLTEDILELQDCITELLDTQSTYTVIIKDKLVVAYYVPYEKAVELRGFYNGRGYKNVRIKKEKS